MCLPSIKECNEILSGRIALEWDEKDEEIKDLFEKYPDNNNVDEVYEKVKLLDKKFSTFIHRVDPQNGCRNIARHICSSNFLDNKLKNGDQTAVDWIANTKDVIGKFSFSFATKYSCFSNPPKFPICDRMVCEILRVINEQKPFYEGSIPSWAGAYIKRGGANEWKSVVDSFMRGFGLEKLQYRDIDKYLWIKNHQRKTHEKSC